MMRHLVLTRFRADVAVGEIASIFAQLADLEALLPGMIGFMAGPNVSPEELSRGFGHGFVCDFEDAAARDAYLRHPAHQAAGRRLVAALEGGLDGLVVVDIELASPTAARGHA